MTISFDFKFVGVSSNYYSEGDLLSYLTMFSIVFIASLLLTAFAASKDKPHGHQGALEAFSGKPLPFKVTGDQEKKLANGDAVSIY